jgi:hypothetical protein
LRLCFTLAIQPSHLILVLKSSFSILQI